MLDRTAFQKHLRSLSWYTDDLRLLVACSGGVDSTVLLNLLQACSGLHLEIVHFDHQLRGEASQSDMAFVQKLADNSNLKVHIISEDIATYANEYSLSIEEAGSQRRRSRFSELRNKYKLDYVVTGQHADDQVETILLNLFHGSGIRGLMGISPATDVFVRPLLQYSQDEIVAYALANAIDFRVDQSNSDIFFLRNNVRSKLLPRVRSCEGDLFKTIMNGIVKDGSQLNQKIEQSAKDVDIIEFKSSSATKIALGMRGVSDYFSPIQKTIFDSAFQLISLKQQGISNSHFDALKSLLGDNSIGKEVQLPGNITVFRDRDSLSFYKHSEQLWSETVVTKADRQEYPFFQLEMGEAPIAEYILDPHYFWYDIDPEEYQLRMASPGDKMFMGDIQRKVFIKQILQAGRVSTHLKQYFPVLVHQGAIVWVPGLRTASSAMISDRQIKENKVKRCIKVQFQKGTFE